MLHLPGEIIERKLMSQLYHVKINTIGHVDFLEKFVYPRSVVYPPAWCKTNLGAVWQTDNNQLRIEVNGYFLERRKSQIVLCIIEIKSIQVFYISCGRLLK